MAKKNTEQKILLMTDTASDIPDEALADGGIVMLPIPIAVDGAGYLERVDFTPTEFYDIITRAKELPTTSHILSITYQQAYQDAFEAGYTHVINVTITSKGSNMFQAAVQGKRQFYGENPGAQDQMQITVLDSGTYTLGYGQPIMDAAQMIREGATAEEVTAWLDDCFSCTEILFASYSLEYAKRSGRIPAAAAFVGDVLGLRPVISIIDGTTTVVEKVRGDKNVAIRIAENALKRAVDKKSVTAIVYGAVDQYGEDLTRELSRRFSRVPKVRYHVGAAITINSGPKVVGVAYRGEKRLNTRAREQDF